MAVRKFARRAILAFAVVGGVACGGAAQSVRIGAFPCADARRLPPSAVTRRTIVEALLRTASVDLYLDPREPGVVVPPRFRRDAGLVLRIGRDLPVPMADPYIDDEGLSATLSFDGLPFHCEVPWRAVVAIVSTQKGGAVWAAKMPPELLCDDSHTGGQLSPR